MAPSSKTKKLTILIAVSSLFLASVSAASLSMNDDYVWLNDIGNQEEFRVEGENISETNLKLVKSDGDLNLESRIMNTSQFRSLFDSGDINLGDYKLRLEDSNGEELDSAKISVRKAKLLVTQNGTGFVDEKLGSTDKTEPLELTVGIRGSSPRETVEKESVDIESFDIDNRKASIVSESDVDTKQNEKDVDVTLYPEISEKPVENERFRILFTYEHSGSEVTVEDYFYPDVSTWRGVPVGETPAINMDYSNIESFSYNIDIFKNGNDVDPDLFAENFDLDIYELNGQGFESEGSEEDWLSVSKVDSGKGDYILELDQIPQLETGTYKFETYLVKDGERTHIDSIRVSNLLKLSGRVMDSSPSKTGVKTEMALRRGNTVIPINTGENGQYYKEIEVADGENNYDSVSMKFFDFDQSTPDAEITVNEVDFKSGEDENLAGGEESIKFDYWQDPEVSEDAIDPINMMAVKFAYPIADNGHKASMKFNPANVNTDNINVYECSNWNFPGRTCLGDWSIISDNDVSITYGNVKANFPISEPYTATDSANSTKNILMNAYLVGTSADLILTNNLDVDGPTGGRIETSGEVDVSGRISSENDNFVEGAEVDITFLEGSAEVHSLDTVETDSEGRFTASGKAPEDPGNYTVKVEASADNYNNLDTELENRFEVFIPEGVALDAESPLKVTLGQDESTTVTVENTGQTEMQDVDLTYSGMNSDFYSTSSSDFSSIESGDSRTVEVTFSLPESYGVDSYPSLDISVSAQNSEDDEFIAEETIQTQLSQPSGTDSSEEEKSSEETEETESSSSFSTQDAVNMTGEFIESQSSLNIALGMILVFLMVIAGAISKKKDQTDDRRARPQIQKPIGNSSNGSSQVKDLTGGKDEEVQTGDEEVEEKETGSEQEKHDEDDEFDSQIDEIAGAFGEEEEDSEEVEEEGVEPEETIAEELQEEEESHFACEVCGEKFDSESGRKLHESVMH
jgi:hypothetical protein